VGTGCVVVTLAVVGAFIILVAILSLSDHEKDTTPRQATQPESVPAFVDPGQLAYLVDDTDAFRGKTALEEGAKVLAARDDIGFHQMLNNGQAIVVPKGTTVKILSYDQSTGYDFREVRIQDGIYYGEAVWVIRLMLRPR
jgi:hypothetical protein